MAKDENLTLREVALRVATPKNEFFGTYEQVANKMIEWVDPGCGRWLCIEHVCTWKAV